MKFGFLYLVDNRKAIKEYNHTWQRPRFLIVLSVKMKQNHRNEFNLQLVCVTSAIFTATIHHHATTPKYTVGLITNARCQSGSAITILSQFPHK